MNKDLAKMWGDQLIQKANSNIELNRHKEAQIHRLMAYMNVSFVDAKEGIGKLKCPVNRAIDFVAYLGRLPNESEQTLLQNADACDLTRFIDK